MLINLIFPGALQECLGLGSTRKPWSGNTQPCVNRLSNLFKILHDHKNKPLLENTCPTQVVCGLVLSFLLKRAWVTVEDSQPWTFSMLNKASVKYYRVWLFFLQSWILVLAHDWFLGWCKVKFVRKVKIPKSICIYNHRPSQDSSIGSIYRYSWYELPTRLFIKYCLQTVILWGGGYKPGKRDSLHIAKSSCLYCKSK